MTDERNHIRATAILPARNIDTSAAFYAELGFVVDMFATDYALVLYEGRELLHLSASASPGVCTVYLNVHDADEWHLLCERAGHSPSAIEDRPWGMREFGVTDPSGNTLRIGTNL